MSFQKFTFDCFVSALTTELVAAGMSLEEAALTALDRIDELMDVSSVLDLMAQAPDVDADCDQAA